MNIIIYGPSCVGKSYLEKELLKNNINLLTIYTNREIRDNDINIKSIDEIDDKYLYVYYKDNNRVYGIDKRELSKNNNVISVIDRSALDKLLSIMKDTLVVYINRDNKDIINCLKNRGYDDKEIIYRLNKQFDISNLKDILIFPNYTNNLINDVIREIKYFLNK